MIKFIDNVGEFFASNYFDDGFSKKVHDKSGFSSEDCKKFQSEISPLKDQYYKYKQSLLEGNLRVKDKIFETHKFHTRLLLALGYNAKDTNYNSPFHLSEKEVIPIRHILYKGDKPHLMIMEIQPLIKDGDEEPDGLFDQRYSEGEDGNSTSEQRYRRSQWKYVFNFSEELRISPSVINKCISELALLESGERPEYIMVLAGNKIFLIEIEKWLRGAYLCLDIESLFFESASKKLHLSLFYLLLSKDMLSPDSKLVLMNQLDEESHKSVYEVSKDLKEGIINSVELLANEALFFLKQNRNHIFEEIDSKFEEEIKDDCLNIIYRILFIFYAESKADLEILPISDQIYQQGYSLEMLRDLEQVPLSNDLSRNGYFFHESLSKLFSLIGSGFPEDSQEGNKSFSIPQIDSPLFSDQELNHLGEVKFRNLIWQDVICQLSLSKKQKKKGRGRISYANLGINQLGNVYESLLAYRGFYAKEDYIEVHVPKKPQEGTYLVPRSRIDEFNANEILTDKNGRQSVSKKGQFVYRLSGRDRQKSASYYTPEVLTKCTVKYTLKSILEKVEKGEMDALELLDLKLLEPAMGAAAFHNELINQLSEAYLNFRQREVKKKVSPDRYREELQKVKAYIATNNTYGVDLNPTAIELGKLSLWLNVIHRDMETPYFSNRLAVGNAVVGAWFKTFSKNELSGKWWECSPQILPFKKGSVERTKDQVYHFLVPDRKMVSSADIDLLKTDYPDQCQRVSDWRKEVCRPISESENIQLQDICSSIDLIILEYYNFQNKLDFETRNKLEIWEGGNKKEQTKIKFRSYVEKEKLNKVRNTKTSPYYKLKMIMDYWCSLWFWDVREEVLLPTRQQYLDDIEVILNIGKSTKYKSPITEKRLSLVKKLSNENKFFHTQLEFIEVFLDRGGFDVIVGNPPWVLVSFEEAGIMSDFSPEIITRKEKASLIAQRRPSFLENAKRKGLYYKENISMFSLKTFMNGFQNYSALKGQKADLYRSILLNALNLVNLEGRVGLVHPDSIYNDQRGGELRKFLYPRLQYHFQFVNTLKLFEIHGETIYSLNIYQGKPSDINFLSMNNLFHPSTIDASLIHNGLGMVGGIKVKSTTGKYINNLTPHSERVINFTEQEMKVLAKTFENNDEWETAKLVSIHSKEIINILNKLSNFKGVVGERETLTTGGWNETKDVNQYIERKTKFPNIGQYELILSGPHFSVSNPIYKTPRSICNNNTHYDIILLNDDTESAQRTNFIPFGNKTIFLNKNNSVNKDIKWIDDYRAVMSKMLSLSGERTLQPCIIPPKSSIIDTIKSVQFISRNDLAIFVGLTSSIVMDFFVKSIGEKALGQSSIKNFPFGIEEKYETQLIPRALLLNCVNMSYSNLWKELFIDDYSQLKWSLEDDRLTSFRNFTREWDSSFLRNFFERRWALIEIDVISAMALGLSLEQLVTIYSIQFPTLQSHESLTYYDNNGNIIYTNNSSGLKGVGISPEEFESVKHLQKGEIYRGTQISNELYGQKMIDFEAPFENRDRIKDYKIAWSHFEQLFSES